MLKPLIEKYNKPVPRYTSYPPANFFRDDFTEEEYRKGMQESNSWNPPNVSLYFHIPFCNKMCHYCGCNAYGMRSQPTVENYHKAIIEELKIARTLIHPDRKVSQIHFGGGTPNAISVEMLEEIVYNIYGAFGFIEDPEIAIECNPAYLDQEYVRRLLKAGFNRLSLGIQDFKTEVLDAVNRDASKLPLQELIEYIRAEKPSASINLDFIYGLPLQTRESFTETIEKAIALRPDRLVTFSYAHLPNIFKAQKRLEAFKLPDADLKKELFEAAYEKITSGGYQAIGFDHYALETDELSIAQNQGTLHRNFQGYCTRRTTGQVYAFGVSAISQLEGMYIQNTKRIDHYIEMLHRGKLPVEKGYSLSRDEQIRREVITRFMCNKKIEWKEIAMLYETSIDVIKSIIQYDTGQLEEFASDGIIKFSDNGVFMQEDALLYVRNVAASFDPLLKNTNKSFSKSV